MGLRLITDHTPNHARALCKSCANLGHREFANGDAAYFCLYNYERPVPLRAHASECSSYTERVPRLKAEMVERAYIIKVKKKGMFSGQATKFTALLPGTEEHEYEAAILKRQYCS